MTEAQRKALMAAEAAFRRYADHHAMKGDETKARANMALAGQMAAALGGPDTAVDTEREACKAIAVSEQKTMCKIALSHPDGSASRDRLFARA